MTCARHTKLAAEVLRSMGSSSIYLIPGKKIKKPLRDIASFLPQKFDEMTGLLFAVYKSEGLSQSESLFIKLRDNKSLLVHYKFYNELLDLWKTYRPEEHNNIKIGEYLSDTIYKILEEHEKDKTLKSIFDGKYQILLNGNTKIISEILEFQDGLTALKNISKKLAKWLDNPDEFSIVLNDIKEGLGQKDDLKDRIKDAEAYIAWENEQYILVDVRQQWDILRKLGSNAWCIVREKHAWDNYMLGEEEYNPYTRDSVRPEGEVNYQFVLFDKTCTKSDPFYMLGITVRPDGYHDCCFDQRDSSVNLEDDQYYELRNVIKNYVLGLSNSY